MSSYPCPVCQTTANLEGPCPGCGRAPDPDAAEVIRLDSEIAAFSTRLNDMRQAYATASAEMQALQARRSKLAAKVWVAAHQPAPTPGGTPPGTAPAPSPAVARPEASQVTIQNVLLILGGLLLGTAAIVFTAVAWATFGDMGRAVILAVITAVTLGVPLIAKARGLRATAETFAALGLLLVVLDGFAAWFVNLAGVADAWSGWTYAGVVAAVTAGTGLAYGRQTGLTGPRLIAAIVVQPAVPLLAAEPLDDRVAGWSLMFSLLAAANLVLVSRSGGQGIRLALRVIGWLGFGVTLLYAHAAAHVLLWTADTMWEGPVTLVTSVLVLVTGGWVAGSRGLVGVTCGWAVIVTAEVVWRVADFDAAERRFLSVALTMAIVGVALAVVGRAAGVLAAAARVGARLGGLVVSTVAGSVAIAWALGVAFRSVIGAVPWWGASPDAGAEAYGWWLPATTALLTVAVAALAQPGFGRASGRSAALFVGIAGTALTVLSAAPDPGTAPWLPPGLDLLGVAVLAGWGWWRARTESPFVLGACWATVVGLGGHALLSGLGRPAISAAVSGVLMAMGLTLALAARGQDIAGRSRPGPVGLATTLALAPLLVASVAESVGARTTVVFHAAIVTIALLPLIITALRGARPSYRRAVVVASGIGGLATIPMSVAYAMGGTGQPNPVYVAVGGLALALSSALARGGPAGRAESGSAGLRSERAERGSPAGRAESGSAGLRSERAERGSPAERAESGSEAGNARVALGSIGLLVIPAIATLLSMGTLAMVLAVPLTWLGDVWSGVAAGSGLAPTGIDIPAPRGVDAAALTIVALTVSLVVWAGTLRWVAGLRTLVRLVGVPVLAWLAVAEVPWPVIPLATLVGGLILIVGTALSGGVRVLPVTAAGLLVGSVQTVSGFAGLLPEEWSTITAFALVTMGFGVIAVRGASAVSRAVAAVLAGSAWLGLAVSSALAADLRPRYVGLTLLVAAALLLFLATAAQAPIPKVAASGVPAEGIRDSGEAAGTDAEIETAKRADRWRLALRRSGMRALEPVAHLAAVITLGLAVGSARRVAETCLLWGVAVGLTALWTRTRLVRTVAAGAIETVAWWALLVAADVQVLEAYTVPVAIAGLIIGFFALRRRPELSSWVGYGPALLAAFGPSTIAMLPSDSSGWRRLALGTVAVAVVVAGSVRRRQAPVVVGGVVLVLLAVHEIAVSWDLLPRWAWIALGGAILVGLGITYERRRRDFIRIKATISTMR